jgi:hypothetical protein
VNEAASDVRESKSSRLESDEVESSFDDDFEDDVEADVIRRGSSRRQSRSRRSGREHHRTEPQESTAEFGSESVGFDDDLIIETQGGRRRQVPTWLETIEPLINANIERHNRSGNQPRPSRGSRNNGGRRRS